MRKFCLSLFAVTSLTVSGLYLIPPTAAVAAPQQASEDEDLAPDCYQLITKPQCPGFPDNCICAISTTSGVAADHHPADADDTATPQVNATPIPRFVQQPIGF